jgi:pimeloyl-ACP methyl ester carboxylesterase
MPTTATAEATTYLFAGLPVQLRRVGCGFPLIFLHGWGGSSRYWLGTLAALQHQHDCIAPDLPGFGDTPPLAEPVTAERLARWVLDFADALGVEHFDLNGHSFCAGVAAYVAAAHPERVRRLVLTSFSTYRDERERKVVEQVHKLMALWMALRRPWMAEQPFFYRNVARRFFYQAPADDELLKMSFREFLKMDRTVALTSAASAGSSQINLALSQVRAPTLLIAGRQDAIMPPAGTPHVASLIPDCRLVWLERCGHLPMIEYPAPYQQLVTAFLRGSVEN